MGCFGGRVSYGAAAAAAYQNLLARIKTPRSHRSSERTMDVPMSKRCSFGIPGTRRLLVTKGIATNGAIGRYERGSWPYC